MSPKQASGKTPTDPKLHAKTPGRSGKATVMIGLVLLFLTSGGLAYYLASRDDNNSTSTPDKPVPTTEFPKPKPITYEETVTPDAYSQFMSVALEIFWSGGNANGKEISGHGYYPSSADIKNPAWAKSNLKLHDQLNKSIKDGSVVYLPKGCDADKPSSSENKCTSFVIQSNGQDVAKSKN